VLHDVFGTAGDRFARRMGEALGEIATLKIAPTLSSPAAEHLLRTTRTIARTALALPALGPRLAQVRSELERRHAALSPRQLVPVHGAPNLHRWLVQGSRLGLVSFDRFALGDPEFDLVTLLAEIDNERTPHRPGTLIESALIDGFEARGTRVDAVRIWLYRVHQRMATVTRTAWAVRADAAARAEHHLQTVEVMLERA
jgi:aminoglycoside phosphotransferase (APT) family kinase protein